jgi:peroxiredoxin Q/BCP
VAGVTRDTLESNVATAQRLRLPYPLLSDRAGIAGRAFGVTHRLGIGSWSIELFRRTTFLVDREGLIAAVWEKVKLRGHAREVLEMAKRLEALPPD